MKKIKDIPDYNKPREKLISRGPESLSDTELLAILLGSGIKGRDVFKVAHTILKKLNTDKKVNIEILKSIDGVGTAKACQIIAAFEFARRRLPAETVIIKNAKDILPLISHIAFKNQEYFVSISLNGAYEVIGNRIITVGLLNTNQVHPREVFADAITDRAASIIVAHNHPSGTLTPSQDDIVTTKRLVNAGKILGISVEDHIIISKKGFLSMKAEGFI